MVRHRANYEDSLKMLRESPERFVLMFDIAIQDYLTLKWIGLPVAFALGMFVRFLTE